MCAKSYMESGLIYRTWKETKKYNEKLKRKIKLYTFNRKH